MLTRIYECTQLLLDARNKFNVWAEQKNLDFFCTSPKYNLYVRFIQKEGELFNIHMNKDHPMTTSAMAMEGREELQNSIGLVLPVQYLREIKAWIYLLIVW